MQEHKEKHTKYKIHQSSILFFHKSTGATNAGDNHRCLIIVIIIFTTTTTNNNNISNIIDNMISQANCDWEGLMTKQDFLGVSVEILKASCDQMDDVKAAFRLDFQIKENTKLDKTKTKATSNQISFVRSALS